MIELDKLSKTFTQKNGKEFRAVDSVSLTVEKGEICVFLGPSGCGKTTTLKMINRIIPPTSGRVLIDGQDTADLDEVTLRRHIGYVIQQIGLFPNMTIEENIMVVPRLLGWDKARCKEKARELMSMVKLEPKQYLQRYPRELSGGQQQRVGVIRALAADAPLLLMDEPFGAVDPINRESIQNEFFEMQRKLGMTVIMVSHDIDEAIKLGDKVAVFKSGRLLQYDHPDTLLAHPADEFVSAFTGQDSTLKRLLLVRAEDAADSSLVTARPQTPVAEALELMDENDRRYLIVVDDQGKGLGYVRRRTCAARRAPARRSSPRSGSPPATTSTCASCCRGCTSSTAPGCRCSTPTSSSSARSPRNPSPTTSGRSRGKGLIVSPAEQVGAWPPGGYSPPAAANRSVFLASGALFRPPKRKARHPPGFSPSTQPARPGACAAEAWSSRPCGLTITVQVIPAESSTPSGTSSMCTRTGTRWARRTQLKVGLTSAVSSRLSGLSRS